ncbi:MAG: hypothetical protein LBS59_03725 [Puniceicoccales bacterium]|nr:hypothetical protein [Puniceicoccales bacterium]
MTPHNAPPARSNFRLSEAEKTDARQALVLLNGIISLSACARAFLGLGLKPAGDSKPISEAVDAFILNCFSRNLREASVSSYNQALALGTSWMSSMGKAMNEIGVFGRSLESLGQMKVAFPFVGGERLNDARQKVSDLAASLAGMKAARDAATPESDIDLFIIGSIGLRQLAPRLRGVADALGREINPYVTTSDTLAKKIKDKDAFIMNILKSPKRWIMGTDDELKTLAK